MKKAFVSLIVSFLLVLTFGLTACGKDGGGTYYPTDRELKINLEMRGYTVEVYDSINDYESFIAISMYYDATFVKATRGDDYLYFARPSNAGNCGGLYAFMGGECKNYDSLVKIENDEKFGNIVYCGTANAIAAAGIKVVEVKI